MLTFSSLNGDATDNANEERRDSKDLGDFLLTHGTHKQKAEWNGAVAPANTDWKCHLS